MIIPGLTFVQKAFFLALNLGRIIFEGAYCRREIRFSLAIETA